MFAVAASGVDPGGATAVALLAAPRLTDYLLFHFEASATGEGAMELPCFEKVDSIFLHLGYLGLALPPSGVFSMLTFLEFEKVQFHGSCNLGDAVSSGRCPSLQHLYVAYSRGVSNFDIRSESLLDFPP